MDWNRTLSTSTSVKTSSWPTNSAKVKVDGFFVGGGVMFAPWGNEMGISQKGIAKSRYLVSRLVEDIIIGMPG